MREYQTVKIWVIAFTVFSVQCVKYEPTWESLDSRPLPAWYDDAKIGMFINWGVYSVPSYFSEWFWSFWKQSALHDLVTFMEKNYPPTFKYTDFAAQFHAEFYDPNRWKDIIVASGVKYVVLSTKHHEGFTMFPSNHSFNWNAGAIGPKQDLVGPLGAVLKGSGVRFGIYHSLFEWFNPVWLQDFSNNFTTQNFIKIGCFEFGDETICTNEKILEDWQKYAMTQYYLVTGLNVLTSIQHLKFKNQDALCDISCNSDKPPFLMKADGQGKDKTVYKYKTMPELYEIVNTYRPDVIWSDGCDFAPSSYWNSTHFLAWLYNESPVKDEVIVNDRWGSECFCKHGGFWTCSDRFHPDHLLPHKWVNAMTIDRRSWGYRRNATSEEYFSIEELLEEVIYTISFGGNILINVGPTSWGTFDPIYEERFRQLGSWLNVNGEGIYATEPWLHQNDTITPKVWYTSSKTKKNVAYCMFFEWPKFNEMVLGSINGSDIADLSLLGSDASFRWFKESDGVRILFPVINLNKMPCLWAWTLKIIFKTHYSSTRMHKTVIYN